VERVPYDRGYVLHSTGTCDEPCSSVVCLRRSCEQWCVFTIRDIAVDDELNIGSINQSINKLTRRHSSEARATITNKNILRK